MNNIKKIAIAAALLGTTFAASAQEVPSINPNWYVGGSIGAIRPDKDWNDLSNDKAFGLRVGKPLNESWDIQISHLWGLSEEGNKSYKQQTLGLDALYFFSRKTFRPFVMVGVGAERDTLAPGINSDRARRSSPYQRRRRLPIRYQRSLVLPGGLAQCTWFPPRRRIPSIQS
ncbi:outer membrane beta-barrel protein [Pseudoduganella sp. UC29_106]|uniref:outer membrane beta-barrel protein n=1 Tax=Pseudoduganella sp. UC29_106 TaxID=3374553 RepID=UPI0037584CE5